MPKERLILNTSVEGVSLKEFVEEDSEPLFELIDRSRAHLSQLGDDTAKKYPTLKKVRLSITHLADYARRRFGIWNGDVIVGSINITFKADFTAGIGYWIGSEFCGENFATIATEAAIDYARQVEYVESLFASVRIENVASQRVLEKSGFSKGTTIGKKIHFFLDFDAED